MSINPCSLSEPKTYGHTDKGSVRFTHDKVLQTTSIYNDVKQIPLNRYGFRTQFDVVQGDSLDEAAKLPRERGKKPPLVLNMANATRPGGGVLKGSFAQEETICRRTNLYVGLTKVAKEQRHYQIPEEGGIYSNGVVVFREADGQLMDCPFEIAVASVAAYNLNGSDSGIDQKTFVEGTKKKIRNMLRGAYHCGHTHLVLSALGCGAFGNNPKWMAHCFESIFREPEFQNAFQSVTFAIFVSEYHKERDTKNLVVFDEYIRTLKAQPHI